MVMGRPRIMEDGCRKTVGISLPRTEWECIEDMIRKGHFTGKSEYFRNLHLAQWSMSQRVLEIRRAIKRNSCVMDVGEAVADQR